MKILKFDSILILITLNIFSFVNVLCSPNILFLIIDDLRPILSCFGDETSITPNINQIGSNGVIFTNAFAQQSLCAPSRTSLLTSRRPDSLHLYDSHSYWRNTVGNYTSLPQYFKAFGYFTQSVGIVSNHSDDYPISWSAPAFHGSTEKYKFSPVCPSMDGKLHTNIVCPVDIETQPEKTLPDLQSTQFAINFIENYNLTSGAPFFLSVGFNKPHIPLKYPKEYLDLYPLSRINLAPNRYYPINFPEVAWNPWTDLRMREDVKNLNISFPFGAIPDYFQKYIRQSYYASTTYIDDLIGRILFAINKKNISNNTIIVLLGDHGWSLGEHSEWSKYSNFDVALKVPLIISVPKTDTTFKYISPFDKDLRQNWNNLKIVKELVELVDIFPTLCDLTALPVPPICPSNRSEIFCSEGTSLKPLMKSLEILNQTNVWKSAVFSQYPRPSFAPQLNSDQPLLKDINIMGYTMRTAYLRYTEWLGFDHNSFQPNWDQIFARELYFDDNQDFNVANDHKFKQIIELLSRQLRNGWRHHLPIN